MSTLRIATIRHDARGSVRLCNRAASTLNELNAIHDGWLVKYPQTMVQVRDARPPDIGAIVRLVRESAASQGALDAVCVDAPTLHDEIFGARSRVHALVADADGTLVGVAIYFFTFSTWVSVNGIHLEDLYVDPTWRRQGVARALMDALVGVARTSGCRRLQWFVRQSNAVALRFYESIGAKMANDWEIMHLDRS